MNARFGVIPAIPSEIGSIRNETRFFCETAPLGSNIYDNDHKLRSKAAYEAREEAEGKRQRLSLELGTKRRTQQKSKPGSTKFLCTSELSPKKSM